ncbi:ABC transporter type 1, transmembrane domain-containing protein, partial [Suillus bovinus]|uniref:ABC transporter type 1, transmembrane domain-containing protein n=1 Tax=Suillus bovinus TaxID=48563 RepID=UPI001B871AD3
NVGKSLFQDAIVGALRNRGVTIILVMHAIHFFSQVDYIYTLNNGIIMESGTYEDLVSRSDDFARFDLEFGGHASEGEDETQEEDVIPQTRITIEDVKLKSKRAKKQATGNGKLEGRLIVKEKRSTGSAQKVYWTYLVAGRGSITGPLLLLLIMLAMQGCLILNSYMLVWWETKKFNQPNSFYQTLYGCLGAGQVIFTFLLGARMDFMSYYVSQSLHHKSVRNIIHASMSFFNTTLMGRILSIFGKDIDSIDNQLPFIITLSSVMGSIIIISVLEPYFVIAMFFIVLSYSYFTAFYRAGARQVKHLDSMLRSLLYAHFSETLTGLPKLLGATSFQHHFETVIDGIGSKQAPTNYYDLDSTIESERANLSVGERSLLSLAHALVKDYRVIVLDEATLVMCSYKLDVLLTNSKLFLDVSIPCFYLPPCTILTILCYLSSSPIVSLPIASSPITPSPSTSSPSLILTLDRAHRVNKN